MSELSRKATAELLGTAFLVVAVVGSGVAATRLSPDDVVSNAGDSRWRPPVATLAWWW